ncbi:sigma-70 family RNA polymerase sigma factor [Alkalihalobacillus oceani]|uniref:RNA polymerase sigma factor n=1 Tax=Halalkalibacter oceani TaxID=1653776 RepID=UPI00204049A7|nr:sigma factor-like helix-turn-helix DNA-binding protein [Halalkalibacter oceani]MCM3761061.1 sigma-70 family RNA polymerase sigma factor [Halalkalibacter oceani]
MKKKYRTSLKKRTEYIYYFANGDRTTITPGKCGVTEIDIQLNHSLNDEEVKAWNRNIYKLDGHLEDFTDGDSTGASDYNKRLADHDANPLNQIIAAENAQEKQAMISKLTKAKSQLLPQQRDLLKQVWEENRTNTDIAAEEGVTEAAIRNRLNKIYKKLRRLLS